MRTVLPIKNPTAAEPTTNPISSSDRPITLYRNITKILFSMYLKTVNSATGYNWFQYRVFLKYTKPSYMFWYMDFIFTSFKDPSVCGLNFEINSTNAKQTKYVTASIVKEPVNPNRVMMIPASIGPITTERDSERASWAFPF